MKQNKSFRLRVTCWRGRIQQSNWASHIESPAMTLFSGTSARQETPPWSWSPTCTIKLPMWSRCLRATSMWAGTERTRLIFTSWTYDTLRTEENILVQLPCTVMKRAMLSYKKSINTQQRSARRQETTETTWNQEKKSLHQDCWCMYKTDDYKKQTWTQPPHWLWIKNWIKITWEHVSSTLADDKICCQRCMKCLSRLLKVTSDDTTFQSCHQWSVQLEDI